MRLKTVKVIVLLLTQILNAFLLPKKGYYIRDMPLYFYIYCVSFRLTLSYVLGK
jgi:hypothetical protein